MCIDPSCVLELSEKILLMNPESYQTWNLRKRALSSTSFRGLGDELLFSIETLKLNPKSYCAWYHRRWVISELLSKHTSTTLAFDYKHELKLCGKLLELDPRNFHCWNYRLFLAGAFGVAHRDELNFTTEKIYQNFSNYSAWHHRVRLLETVKASDSSLFLQTLEADAELCKSVIFTKPSDQSAWFYLKWLARQDASIKERMIVAIRELDELEPGQPLVLLALAELTGEKRLLVELAVKDPMRAGLYKQLGCST